MNIVFKVPRSKFIAPPATMSLEMGRNMSAKSEVQMVQDLQSCIFKNTIIKMELFLLRSLLFGILDSKVLTVVKQLWVFENIFTFLKRAEFKFFLKN